MKRRAGATVTFSVSVDPATRRRLKRLADERHEGNVSALIAELAEEAAQQAAFERAWAWLWWARAHGGGDGRAACGVGRGMGARAEARDDFSQEAPSIEEEERGVTSISGLTFDTGVLVALERRHHRAWTVYRAARHAKARITVPTAVIAEWWRGRSDVRALVRSGLRVEALDEPLARIAGEAMARVPKAPPVDAIVMGSAASRGDVVYTSDVGDLERFRSFFPGVRVLSV